MANKLLRSIQRLTGLNLQLLPTVLIFQKVLSAVKSPLGDLGVKNRNTLLEPRGLRMSKPPSGGLGVAYIT
jgi:hypothetical protein